MSWTVMELFRWGTSVSFQLRGNVSRAGHGIPVANCNVRISDRRAFV